MRKLLLIALFALGLLAPALLAPTASASPYVRFGIQDDAWLEYGPGSVDDRLDQVDELGVDVVRVTLDWRQIEPHRGDWDWSIVDPVLNGLHERKIAPLVTLYGSPAWANGGRGENWAPKSASMFAAFARAAARRYPFVHMWTIWNEPNQARSFRPTSPRLYVQRLLDPAYKAIHTVQPHAKVAGGVTAPRGGSHGVSPVAWLEGMHAAHAKLDAYAHNPYPLRPKETPSSGGCDHCTTITLATLERLERLVARDFPHARIWLTEYGYQTDPPDKLLGVSYTKQARYMGEAALRVHQLPRVDILIHYLLQDEPNVDRWQSGLQTVKAREKPSYDAFCFPLAQVSRKGSRTVLWGQVRPGKKATYRLQERRNGHWRSVGANRRTSSRGYFELTVRAGAGDRFRIWVPKERAYSAVLVVQ
ncbi:MAG TPA: hypothetical protein VF186_07580 [Gaiellaceae bacterium]